MAEYIEREDAVSALDVAERFLRKLPAADMVAVVRCKDCDKSKPSNMCGAGWCFCHNNLQHHKEDHFCGYGERREADAKTETLP